MKHPRVFLGLTEVSGYYRHLAEGFRQIGVPVSFVDLTGHPFAYGGGEDHPLAARIRRLHAAYRELPPRRVLRRCLLKARLFLLKLRLLVWALRHHDAFIFGFATSFFHFRELWLLRLLGKKVIYQFHGSDSRPPYMDAAALCDEDFQAKRCILLTRRRKRAVRAIDRHADVVVNIPPQGHFHERKFVNWLRIGLPCLPPSDVGDAPSRTGAGPVRILHCPTRRDVKGTGRIRGIVAHLKGRGLDVELVEISGQPNTVVAEEMSRCDIVLDQLYADYGMPGLATEAAWFARPVVIGGYAATLWDELLDEDLRPPTLYCAPDEVARAVERLVRDRTAREELGRRARQFVETRWRPSSVARRYLRLIAGDIPDDWLYDPSDIRYLHGCGLTERQVRRRLREMLEAGGPRSLMVSDKPALTHAMVEFATGAERAACAE